MPQPARPHWGKDPCPCRARIGNATNDIHDVLMAEDELSDELSDDGMQAGEKEAIEHGIGEGTREELRAIGKQTGVKEETTVGYRAWAASKAGGHLVPEREGYISEEYTIRFSSLMS
ncbi:uncharacterized protein LOC121968041 [Zingiber officinale]|uniref:uncharacterized protein LOC121968041 n=1 Tax=Zingiber officinale TaxID=94328 RepID=UPI001C4ADD44|nr:uncharacterized protein LOC121968041 [Zingiber officinale]